MTSKKLIKELMALGASRNRARKMRDIAREEGMSNVEVFYWSCEMILAHLMKEAGIPGEDHG